MNGGSLMAQVLKDDVKENILKAATAKFNEIGYINTKMRDIAVKSNVSVGNIYRYFKDKENLFESIVQPVVNQINSIFDSFDKEQGIDSTNKAAKEFIKIYIENKEIFMLVIENSSNTKFDSIKNALIEKFHDNLLKFPVILAKVKKDQGFKVFTRAFSYAFINGIISILREKIDDSQKIFHIDKFLSFMRNNMINEYIKG